MFKRIACMLGRHEANRGRVWHDGLDFRSRCRTCGKPMLRTDDGWRVYLEDAHSDARRDADRHTAQQ